MQYISCVVSRQTNHKVPLPQVHCKRPPRALSPGSGMHFPHTSKAFSETNWGPTIQLSSNTVYPEIASDPTD